MVVALLLLLAMTRTHYNLRHVRTAGVDWSEEMQKGPIPTRGELLNYKLTYETVLYVHLPSYYTTSGRYRQVDTARKNALSTALFDLVWGKVPNEETHRIFTSGNFKEMSGVKEKWMLDWTARTQPDVRKKRKTTGSGQQSIVQYIVRSGAQHGRDPGAIHGTYVLTHTCHTLCMLSALLAHICRSLQPAVVISASVDGTVTAGEVFEGTGLRTTTESVVAAVDDAVHAATAFAATEAAGLAAVRAELLATVSKSNVATPLLLQPGPPASAPRSGVFPFAGSGQGDATVDMRTHAPALLPAPTSSSSSAALAVVLGRGGKAALAAPPVGESKEDRKRRLTRDRVARSRALKLKRAWRGCGKGGEGKGGEEAEKGRERARIGGRVMRNKQGGKRYDGME